MCNWAPKFEITVNKIYIAYVGIPVTSVCNLRISSGPRRRTISYCSYYKAIIIVEMICQLNYKSDSKHDVCCKL